MRKVYKILPNGSGFAKYSCTRFTINLGGFNENLGVPTKYIFNVFKIKDIRRYFIKSSRTEDAYSILHNEI